MKEFNLLATTSRGFEAQARSELQFLLEKIGDSTPVVERTGISGVIAVKTKIEAITAINQLRTVLHQTPYEFRFVLRVIPIEKVVQTDLEPIQSAVTELASNIGENETFRVTVEKRFTAMHSKDIVEKIASSIKRTVDLTKPDKIVLIEIVGKFTGISVIRPENTLSVQKEKLL